MSIKVNNLLKINNDPRSAIKNGKQLVLNRIKNENKTKVVVAPEVDLSLDFVEASRRESLNIHKSSSLGPFAGSPTRRRSPFPETQ